MKPGVPPVTETAQDRTGSFALMTEISTWASVAGWPVGTAVGVGAGVEVGADVGVAVGAGVGLGVAVEAAVTVAVAVGVDVAVGVPAGVDVGAAGAIVSDPATRSIPGPVSIAMASRRMAKNATADRCVRLISTPSGCDSPPGVYVH
jgi:hypothetical protein